MYRYFNPQGPHGPRPFQNARCYKVQEFQSTRPSRASTAYETRRNMCPGISIHKALTGLDVKPFLLPVLLADFNPQGPHGPRPGRKQPPPPLQHFNPQGPHGPRRAAQPMGCLRSYFNPQGPHGPRRQSLFESLTLPKFQSTRPSRAST